MAITRSTAAERTARPVSSVGEGTRALESYLLLAASLLIAVGLCLVYFARLAESRGEARGRPELNLNGVQNAEELLPHLGVFTDLEDRLFAARQIYAYVREHELVSVGQLSSIRVTIEHIRKVRGLAEFSARVDNLAPTVTREVPTLSLLTAPQLRRVRETLVVRTEQQYLRTAIWHALLFFAAFYAVHIAWRRIGFSGDRLLLPMIHVLSGMGAILMISLRDPLRDRPLLPDFVLGVVIGCALLFLCSRPDYERSALRRMAYIPLLASFLLSLALLVFGSGPGTSDAKVNLVIGSISTQPVELIKLLLVLFLAGYFAQRWEFFRELKEPRSALPRWLSGFDIPRLRYAAPVAAGVALAIAFFFLQKDLGPALVFSMLFLSLYGVARGRVFAVLAGCAVMVFAFAVGYWLETPRTVGGRVEMWLSPWDNFVRGGGDHLAQSLWSFASGGAFGSGLGLGEAETVPAVHTDLVLAAAGEELGFVGLLGIYAIYALLVHRALRITKGSRGDYTFFLGLGMALLIGLQVALISGGILGLVPLSGVVTPFLNYGKSSTIVNFIAVGILAGLSATPGTAAANRVLTRPVRWIEGMLAVLGLIVVLQAARVQILQGDRFLVAGTLVRQADGYRRYAYNPRILEAARLIPRGSIFDRNGIPLASGSLEGITARRADYESLGIQLDKTLDPADTRHYPFGGMTFHVLGDPRRRINWAASNTAFVERDFNTILQGYDDGATLVNVMDTPAGAVHPALKLNYRELVPLVRYRHRPEHALVQKILTRERDLKLNLDIRLQVRAAELLAQHIRNAGKEKGAAIVIDPDNGDLLASVTYPWREENSELLANGDEAQDKASLLDRARFGLYPPGSVFKLITATSALEGEGPGVQEQVFQCKRLPDQRVGNYVRGSSRPVRDDILDLQPHGDVNLNRGIVVSCNAYFAQLATYVVGSERLLRTAELFGIRVAAPNTPDQLKDALPQAAYGQGQVVASPLQMARVAASMANGGRIHAVRVAATQAGAEQQVIRPETSRLLASYMRGVVTGGTGRTLSGLEIPVAGKTGTAELRDQLSHAWFVGFAPYGTQAEKRIAFAIIIENGRYGGRIAAPLAGEIVAEASRLGLLR